MNHIFKLVALLCVCAMTAGTVSAQDTLQGSFFGANDSNTVVLSTGALPSTGGWSTATTSLNGNFGYTHSLIPDVLQTTIGGFNPGDVYDVAFVYTATSNFNTNLAAGFTSTGLTSAPVSNGDVVGGTLTGVTVVAGPGIANATAYDLNLGPQTVNGAGELILFVDDSPLNFQAGGALAYQGLSADLVSSSAIPEPSSLALLGLMGGLGLLRRRR